jgi:hypothetical protein
MHFLYQDSERLGLPLLRRMFEYKRDEVPGGLWKVAYRLPHVNNFHKSSAYHSSSSPPFTNFYASGSVTIQI